MEEAHKADISRFTTMKVGGSADRLCQPASLDEVLSLVEQLTSQGEPWFVLGGGSNTLVSSAGIRGTVIRTTRLISIESPEPSILIAAAGARLPHLAKYAASLGLAGLEFAVGIPGTVGGAVIMNAGAHGSCMANVVESALILNTQNGKVENWSNADMQFKYRKCALDPAKHIVLSARLRLQQGSTQEIEAATTRNEEYRWRTQPLGFPNLGSTFKNPFPDRSAGLLLDQSGAKEFKEGAAAVSAIHANFVVNLGRASSDDVLHLLQRMQHTVQNKFSIRLMPEWKTLGEFNEIRDQIWSDKNDDNSSNQ